MWRPDVPSSGAAPMLLRELLDADVVAVPDDVAARLAAVRDARPSIVWFGINERRVDAVLDTANGGQYRLVYFTDDGSSITSIELFRRPEMLDALAGGQVVVVNGPSGSGKSSVLEALAAQSDHAWVLFDEPVMGAVDQPYLIWRDRAPHLHRGFLEAMAALARTGNRVGLAAAGHPAALIDEVFAEVPTLRVGLDCDVETLLERERGRVGRWGGLVEASLGVHEGWDYDIRFNTSAVTPHAIAAVIDDHVR
jgi:chloramphenicol 3-O-phosphotransferase